mmetsp:Transcript_13775/g.23017  ORF Transcript_13775/g.23017 Transcript_13775/m.23017 type:complete len:105 (+) Transcript_13775:359-673(+)
MNVPYLSVWPQAIALQALPQNVPTSLKNLASLMDEVWYHAGDASFDMNWYIKRVGLGFVYGSTELYMLTDYSSNFEESWSFLERRLQDTLTADGGVRTSVKFAV